ncbi:protein NrdI [Pseudoclavibacter endophyticus]|uniref:Protein NrdI n=1 Tax=Pseudoclavibacter endophyticus TaxID=1778590 RepID=A0A6H9WF52_9MICO|nr:class Ib ribonucleoside-diphosphate reductase assembly flavoprotein NrdI [Pseudoclavibacter endophyticus]KAB1649532.1 class Ib ribonucleoside-diphosphate reductase assembly flavoprotein NrdI [Pseudoclavibacter endophyticus]GGA61868.1 protein NrdI [Pseudoclavibacter endophyticus]
MSQLIYFSSVSNNTHRFVEKLGREAVRIPVNRDAEPIVATEPYVLIVPTYGGGDGRGAVPKQVIKFLNVPGNRELLRGVIAGGNTNFGRGFGIAADIIAAKCHVPALYRFELFGTEDDVEAVTSGLDSFWQQQQTLSSTSR